MPAVQHGFSLYPPAFMRLVEANRHLLGDDPKPAKEAKPARSRAGDVPGCVRAAMKFEETGDCNGFYGVKVLHPTVRNYMDTNYRFRRARRAYFRSLLSNNERGVQGRANPNSFGSRESKFKKVAYKVRDEGMELLKQRKI